MNKYTPDEDKLQIPARIWIPSERTTKLCDLLRLPYEAMTIDVIAHSLAITNRFCGHAEYPYSVALHSVLVSMLLDEDQQAFRLEATLHDAAETFTGDLINPIKRIPEVRAPYKKIENAVDVQLRAFHALPLQESYAVKEADTRALYLEQYILQDKPLSDDARQVLCARDVEIATTLIGREMSWKDARDVFLEHYKNITLSSAA